MDLTLHLEHHAVPGDFGRLAPHATLKASRGTTTIELDLGPVPTESVVGAFAAVRAMGTAMPPAVLTIVDMLERALMPGFGCEPGLPPLPVRKRRHRAKRATVAKPATAAAA